MDAGRQTRCWCSPTGSTRRCATASRSHSLVWSHRAPGRFRDWCSWSTRWPSCTCGGWSGQGLSAVLPRSTTSWDDVISALVKARGRAQVAHEDAHHRVTPASAGRGRTATPPRTPARGRGAAGPRSRIVRRQIGLAPGSPPPPGRPPAGLVTVSGVGTARTLGQARAPQPPPDPREPSDMNVQKFRRRGIVRTSALLAIAALAWQANRTAARTRRLEHLTHAWLVAGSPAVNADQHHCNRITGA